MSRRSMQGKRFTIPPSVGARWVQRFGISIIHHKRGNDVECPVCWDEYTESPSRACTTCDGTGYIAEYRRKKAIVTYAQPAGVFGHSEQFFNAGGRMVRESIYVYMSNIAAKDVQEGDRFIIDDEGHRSEVLVMNDLPVKTTQGKSQLVMFECTTPANQDLSDI